MPNLSVVFKNRNFTGRVPSSVPVRVERYSWDMVGGPDKAYLRAEVTADKWELMKLLRCPVEIYGDDGSAVWWGYVNRVSVPNGDNQRVGKGLDELYNYIIAAYLDADTSAASEVQSIAEYGQKEKRITVSNANQTQAEQQRDIYLTEHQYPTIEFDFSGGRQEIQIECYGWYKSLDWKYYADSDQTNTDNETQIENIIASAGQFIAGSVIEDATGFTSNEYRDGTTTALTSINQLLNAGTTNTRPLLAYVDKDRHLHVYERTAEPLEPGYLLQDDNKLTTLPGDVIADQECRVGVWAKLKDAPGVDMPAFFIESAEYDARENATSYRPAGSYEQVRLARYIASITDTNDGGGIGSGSYYPLTLDTPPYKREFEQWYTGDVVVASSTNDYIPPFSVQFFSSSANLYFRWPSTGTWGNDGIDLLTGLDHIFTANIRLSWSTPPATGNVNIAVRRNRGGSVGTIQNYYFDAGLASVTGYYAFTITLPLSLQADDAVGLYISNTTNQSVTAGGGVIFLEKL